MYRFLSSFPAANRSRRNLLVAGLTLWPFLLVGCGGSSDESDAPVARVQNKIALSVYDGSRRTIHLMNPDGSGLRSLGGKWEDGSPSISPDGSKILYMSRSADSVDWEDPLRVWVMNADGTGRRQLTENGASAYTASFSPDGTKIVFNRNSKTYQGTEIWVMNADGSEQRHLGFGTKVLFTGSAPLPIPTVSVRFCRIHNECGRDRPGGNTGSPPCRSLLAHFRTLGPDYPARVGRVGTAYPVNTGVPGEHGELFTREKGVLAPLSLRLEAVHRTAERKKHLNLRLLI